MSLFSKFAAIRAGIDAQLVDLTAAPFKRARAEWTDPKDYTATQRFARGARRSVGGPC